MKLPVIITFLIPLSILSKDGFSQCNVRQFLPQYRNENLLEYTAYEVIHKGQYKGRLYQYFFTVNKAIPVSGGTADYNIVITLLHSSIDNFTPNYLNIVFDNGHNLSLKAQVKSSRTMNFIPAPQIDDMSTLECLFKLTESDFRSLKENTVKKITIQDYTRKSRPNTITPDYKDAIKDMANCLDQYSE